VWWHWGGFVPAAVVGEEGTTAGEDT